MVTDLDRRFLVFPAVAPCGDVSPAALIQALIAIGDDIIRFHRTMSFTSQKRIVQELVREVEILVVFFKEVQDSGKTTSSAIVSFSEIYVTFQKIRHMVWDCGRRGARLWLILKSDYILSEFRVLVRSVATALDVLPFSEMDVSLDTKEAVRLIAEQAGRIDLKINHTDEKISDAIRLILAEFEEEIVPDRESINTILKYLQIRYWSDCEAEVQFLEEEILKSDGGFDEIALLSGLRGFILYARSIIFEVMDSRKPKLPLYRSEDRLPKNLKLEEITCPISLDLMSDPVTVSTGQTYDRVSITKWLAAGNRTCPVTGTPLVNTDIVPNSTLRKLIKHQQSPVTNDVSGRQFNGVIPVPSRAIIALCRLLVNKLSNPCKDDEAHKTVSEIRLLSKTGLFERGCLVDAGAIPLLLDLHFSSNSSLQHGSTAAILNLSKHPEGRAAIFNYKSMTPILHVISNGLKPEARQNAAAAFFYLSSVEDYRKQIGESTDAIPALVDLLKNGTVRGKRNAAVAIVRLLLHPPNYTKVIAAGAISELLDLLSSEREDLVGDCLALLAALAEKPEGAFQILQSSEVPSFVSILLSHSSKSGKEYCLSLLLHLCKVGGEKVVTLLEKIPSLVPALRLLLSEGSSRVSKKASSLIRILRHASAI